MIRRASRRMMLALALSALGSPVMPLTARAQAPAERASSTTGTSGATSFGVADWNLNLSASHKAIVGVQALRQEALYPSSITPFTEQRFRFQGTFSRDWFLVGFANELSAFIQRPNEPHLPIPDATPPPAWDARWRVYDNTRQGISLIDRIDRLYAQMTFGQAELTVGKQVIPIGVGHVFSAVSQTPRRPFVTIDPEYQNTEDAVSAKWTGFATFEARYLPKAKRQQEDSFHLRAKGNVGGYDAAVVAGRSDDKAYVGVEAAGNVGDQVLRAEAAGYLREGKWWLQALAGLDTVFSATWSAEFELFYNGFGNAPEAYTAGPSAHRSAPWQGRWYAGSMVTWEAGQRWKSSLGGMVNVVDPSVLFHLQLSYSWGTNLDLVAGQYLGVGGPGSEFGGMLSLAGPLSPRLGLPNMTYALLKYSF